MNYCSDTIRPEFCSTNCAPFVVCSCNSVYLAHWSRIYHIEQMWIKKVSGTLCLECTSISWLDLMMSITPKGARICNLCHARCTSCSTFINGWIFRQKKAHTYVLCAYVHKKRFIYSKTPFHNFLFLKLCMIVHMTSLWSDKVS